MDGLPPGTWLGQERPMSWPVRCNVDAMERFSKISCRSEDLQYFLILYRLFIICGAIFDAEMKICSVL